MKKFIGLLLAFSLIYSNAYAIRESGSNDAASAVLYGKQTGGTLTAIKVNSDGSVSGAAGWTSDGSTKTTTTYNVGVGTTAPTTSLSVGSTNQSGVEGLNINTLALFFPIGTKLGVQYQQAQSFVLAPTSGGRVTSVKVTFNANVGTPTGTVTATLETDNADKPSGTLIEAAATTTFTPTQNAVNTITFTLSSTLAANTKTWLHLVSNSVQTNGNYWQLSGTSSLYTDGKESIYDGASWTTSSTGDIAFLVYFDSASGTDILVDGTTGNITMNPTVPSLSTLYSTTPFTINSLAQTSLNGSFSIAVSDGYTAGDTTNASMISFFNNVNSGISSTGNGPGFRCSRTLTGDLNTHCYEDQSSLGQSGTYTNGYASYDAQIYLTGSNTQAHLFSYQARPVNNNSGTVSWLGGFWTPASATLNKGGGVVTKYTGIYLGDVVNSNGSTVTTDYGIYIDSVTAGTTNYGIYEAGVAQNYFGGKVYVDAPAAQTIAAGNTIAHDACGSIKLVSSAGAVTTSTTDTFTAPAAGNDGCLMNVCNSGANNITLDNNANFKSAGGADVVLTPDDCVQVGSTGASGVWYQLSALVAN